MNAGRDAGGRGRLARGRGVKQRVGYAAASALADALENASRNTVVARTVAGH
jgi:hypothetical protein